MEETKAEIGDERRESKRRATTPVKRALNTTNLSQSLWLVKVPAFLAEAWADAKQDEVLGSLMVGLKPSTKTQAKQQPVKQMIIRLDPNRPNHHTIPEQYTLDEVKTSAATDDNTVLAFNVDPTTKEFSIEGTVTKSMLMKPPLSSEYHSVVQRRSMALANRREVAVADPHELEKAAKQSCTIEFLSSVRGDLKRKASSKTSTELDSASLRSRMFEAFALEERQPFDAILAMCRDVTGFTREQDLRDLLDKYALYHSKGPYRGLWELKSQFRDHQAQAAENPASSSSSSASGGAMGK